VDTVREEASAHSFVGRSFWIAKAFLASTGLRDGTSDRTAMVGAVVRLQQLKAVSEPQHGRGLGSRAVSEIRAMSPVDGARVLLTDIAIQRQARDRLFTIENRVSWRAASLAVFLLQGDGTAFEFSQEDSREDLRHLIAGRFDLVASEDLAQRIASELAASRLGRDGPTDAALHRANGSAPRIGFIRQVSSFLKSRQTPVASNDVAVARPARRVTR
jgi:hypothetical protein